MLRQLARVLCVSLLCVGLAGCSDLIAEQMVRAPNRDKPAASRTDSPPDEMTRFFVDRQLRVAVGPPDASLSVWIFDPYAGKETLEFQGYDRHMDVKVLRAPNPPGAPVPKGTIFVLHGIQDDKTLGPYVIFREAVLHQGYRVVQLDFRGHGRSTGEWITYGAVESHDMVQVLDALEQQHLIAGPVGVIGISYGGAIGIMWAAIDPRVKAVVAIEPYTSLRDVARDGASFVLGPARHLFSDDDINQTVTRAGKIAGFNPADASPLRAITQTHTPILLVHSRDDEFIPWHHSQRLHDAAPDHTKLILVSGSSHFDIWRKSFDVIKRACIAWFNQNLLNTTAAASPAQ
jgi:pimeloyl-ACP methyl ester carboxylesterase